MRRARAARELRRRGRFLRKTAAGWVYTSYVWSEDEKQAIRCRTTSA